MTKKADDKKPRAKRSDLEETDARFAGILRVCESGNGSDNGLEPAKVAVIKQIAQGSTLEEVVKAAGWRALGLEVEETEETEETGVVE